MVICFTDFAVRLCCKCSFFWLVKNCFCMCGCDLHCKPIIVGLHSCWWRRGSPDLSASNVEKQPGRNFAQWSCGNRSHEKITCEHHQPAEGKTRAFTAWICYWRELMCHTEGVLSDASELHLFILLLCCFSILYKTEVEVVSEML